MMLLALTIVLILMEAPISNNHAAVALFDQALGLVAPLAYQKALPPTNVLSTESATVNVAQYGPEIICTARVHHHRVVR